MKLEQKKAATLYHAGFNSYLYQKKRWTPRGRQQNRGEDRRRGERGMKGWMMVRERERESGRKSEQTRATRRRECEGEGKKWGWEGKRKERFLLVAPPRIQSHRVYSSVHLILFIGFKAFAGTPYLRIWSILWAKDLDDTCGPPSPLSYHLSIDLRWNYTVIARWQLLTGTLASWPIRPGLIRPSHSARLEIAKKTPAHFQHF